MSSERHDSFAFEAVWAEIKLLLEWQAGFSLIWVLGDDQRVTAQLEQRLRDFSQARTRRLQSVRPSSPETAVSDVLQAVFATDGQGALPHFTGPLWVDLMQGPQATDWQRSRQQTLTALNQRRSALERDFARPLLLHVPIAMAGELVSWAPDLWSVRALVAVLPNAVRSPAGSPAEMRTLSMSLEKIGQAEIDDGRLEAALAAYRESLEIGRRLRGQLGDTPQALRDLSVGLDKVGDVERDSGRMDAALQAYRESLEIGRRLRGQLGDTPQALRDLSVSLDNVGNVEHDSGRMEAALQAYRESLEIGRRLRGQLGDTPQALRDLGFVLNRLVALNTAGVSAEDKQAWVAELGTLRLPNPPSP